MHRNHAGFQMIGICIKLFPHQIGTANAERLSQHTNFLRQLRRVAEGFPCRRHQHLVQRVCPPLGFRIEIVHGVNGIVPEFQPHRSRKLHRKDVHNIAADGELSLTGNAVPADIAAVRQLSGQFRQVCRAVPL